VALEGVLGALDALPLDAPVPARLEQDVLRRVRILAEDEPAGEPALVGRWLRAFAPAVAATAVVGIAVVGLRSGPVTTTGTTGALVTPAPATEARPALVRRAKTRVPAEPPAALASRPDLFVDLPMLRELDKLQHFDSIATMDDDAEAPSPSSG